jgi:peptidoglycan/LPS O-acetylase OafA/YrhL
MDLLLMYMMNDSIDQPIEEWDAMFLPGELEENVLDLEYETAVGERRQLIEDTVVYHKGDSRSIPDRAPAHWPWTLWYGFLIGVAALLFSWWWQRDPERTFPRALLGVHQALVGLIAGLPGLALFVMSVATDHTVTYWNENLFFANPLTFTVLPLGVALALGRRWTLKWLQSIWVALVATGALGLMLKVLPSFDQQNRQPVAFLLPITIGCAAACWLVCERLGAEEESASASADE